MAVSWQRILIEALDAAEVVGVAEVVRAHLRRPPTRSELTSARRAARLYADRDQAQLVHVRSRSSRGERSMLLLARLDADFSDENRLRDIAIGRGRPAFRRGHHHRDESRVVDILVRAVAKSANEARRVDVSKLDDDQRRAFAGDLVVPLHDLERLRQRLRRRD